MENEAPKKEALAAAAHAPVLRPPPSNPPSPPSSPSWSFSSGKKPSASQSLASGAGRLGSLKAGLGKMDAWLESSLFGDAPPPTRKPTPASPGPSSPVFSPASASASASASPMAAPVVIRASGSTVGASVSNSGAGGLNWGAGFDSLKKRLAQSGSSLGGGGNDAEESDGEEEHPGAVGMGAHRRSSPREAETGGHDEEAEEEEEQQQHPVVDPAEQERAAALLVKEELELAEGATIVVMHRGKGLPLAALDAETRALVKLSWTRVHLQQQPAAATIGGAEALASHTAREEPLPALDNQALYTPSVDDHGCLLAVRCDSAPLATASKRLLLARPVELDARVEAMVEGGLQAASWAGEARLRITTSAPQPPSSPLHHVISLSSNSNTGGGGASSPAAAAATSRLAHEVAVALTLPPSGPLRLVLESRNADTPRGFVLDLESGAATERVKVRPSLTQPALLEVEVPIVAGKGKGREKGGLVRWEGHPSGELFVYAQLLRCSSSFSAFDMAAANNNTDEGDNEQEEAGSAAADTVTFALQLSSAQARDALLTLLRMGMGKSASPPWAVMEAAKASKAAEERARAVEQEATARRQAEKERDAALQEKEALAQALASERMAGAALKQQAEAASTEAQALRARAEASEAEAQRLGVELERVKGEAAAQAGRLEEVGQQLAATTAKAEEQEAAVARLTEAEASERRRREKAEAELAQAKAEGETRCRALQEAAGQAKLETAQAKRRAEAVARDLKLAMGEGVEAAVGMGAGGAAGTAAAAAAAELARLRVRVGNLEAALEVAQQERAAFKTALAQTIEALAPPPPPSSSSSSSTGKASARP